MSEREIAKPSFLDLGGTLIELAPDGGERSAQETISFAMNFEPMEIPVAVTLQLAGPATRVHRGYRARLKDGRLLRMVLWPRKSKGWRRHVRRAKAAGVKP